MPPLTFQLALVIAVCFVSGSIVSWALQERRLRRERTASEQQMTRVLQARNEVYEGLERSFVTLTTRFDTMEAEFKQRLAEARNPRGALEQTLRLRSQNPELWDLERDNHRTQGEQLAQISRQAARIGELMDQLQALEGASAAREGEIAELRERHETAVANFAEADQAASLKIGRLESRVRELEPVGALYEATRRELEISKTTGRELEAAATAEVSALQSRLSELQGELSQARAQATAESTQAREQRQQLEFALKGTEAELALYRAKLDQHSSHVGQAWSVLTELKPMLAALEQQLKHTDEPSPALPATPAPFDLSVLDEPKTA